MPTIQTQFPLKTASKIAAIDAWWRAFKGAEADINAMFSNGEEFPLVDFMKRSLDPVHPGIMWEFGPGKNKKHVLCIAPEDNRDLLSLSRLMLECAPECEFFEFRLNRDVTLWEQFVRYKDSRFSWDSPEGIMFTCETGDHNLIDIVFYTSSEHQDEKTDGNCFLMAESLLGEDVIQRWVGYIDIEQSPAKKLFQKRKATHVPDDAKPVSQLREAIAIKIADIRNNLPKEPLYTLAENHDWNMLQMDPDEQDDYSKMDDLFIMPVLAKGPSASLYNGQRRFSSERFSALGEIFVYVKLDGTADGINLDDVKSRGAIEDSINDALKPGGLGGVIGGGTGRRYSYIFLALTDFDAAMLKVIETLQGLAMPRRAWILFNDYDREQEWIGVWDDSPQPLLPSYT